MPTADLARAGTLGALLAETRSTLARAGFDHPGLDARLLVEHFTGTTRAAALATPDLAVDAAAAAALRTAVARRLAGTPVHRILGHREFYGLRLELSPDVLEPRPDTETLVDMVLPFAREILARTARCRILDLGTGSGAIALALLSELPGARALGVDISEGALEIAAGNADMNGCGTRFDVCRSDWFSQVEGDFDLIVANPPYVATEICQELPREVRDFDPRGCLDGGEDGLDAYRVIAANAASHLSGEGLIAVEIGYDQMEAVRTIFQAHAYRTMMQARDLAEHDRAIGFTLKQSSEPV